MQKGGGCLFKVLNRLPNKQLDKGLEIYPYERTKIVKRANKSVNTIY